MSEWSRSAAGGSPTRRPRPRRHFEEVADDIRHEREADRVKKAHRTRPWWKFWAKRSG